MSARAIVAALRTERGECLDLAKTHRDFAKTGNPDLSDAHIAWAEAYEDRAGKLPEEAVAGDPCGLLEAAGPNGEATICEGTLEPYAVVWGIAKHPGLEPPLACATCLGTVP